MRNPLSKTIETIKPSGIRKYFDIVSEMNDPDVISLGVGEPDFETPWHIRDEGIYSLERGRTFILQTQVCWSFARRLTGICAGGLIWATIPKMRY